MTHIKAMHTTHQQTRRQLVAIAAAAFFLTGSIAANAQECEATTNEYPTPVIADYVLGCMAANGNSFESLHQCSCSIDFIRERMSFADYEKIQTVMQVQQDRGQRGVFYRDSTWAKERVDALLEIQAESTLRCF